MGQASTNKIQNNAKIKHTKLEKQASNPIFPKKVDGPLLNNKVLLKGKRGFHLTNSRLSKLSKNACIKLGVHLYIILR